jgi:hypothetical protein
MLLALADASVRLADLPHHVADGAPPSVAHHVQTIVVLAMSKAAVCEEVLLMLKAEFG